MIAGEGLAYAAATVAAVIGLAGCSALGRTSSEPQGEGSRPVLQHCYPGNPAPACQDGVRMGVAYEYELYTHCGIRQAYFAGRYWVADPPLGDGSGNPPPGWGNPTQRGSMELVAPQRAEFRAGPLGATFEPAAPSFRPQMCA